MVDKKDAEKPPRQISREETLGYVTALTVLIVDNLGPQFTGPELVTYGEMIGASVQTVAFFFTARGIANMVSLVWMPLVSDRCGCRKWVAFVSTVGVTIGYFIQACAYLFNPAEGLPANWGPSCMCFLTGRIIVGLFSGMQPVLQAYITELSAPEPELITQRLVVVQVAANVSGVVASPLSGLFAKFGLQVPFFAVAVCGLVSIFVVPVFFKEVKDIRTDLTKPKEPAVDPSGTSVGISLQNADGLEEDKSEIEVPFIPSAPASVGNPMCDVVVLSMFLAYMCLMFVISGISIFLTPILLKLPDFGIGGDTVKDFRENISTNMAMANIPFGLLQVFVAIILFVPVTKRFGEVPVVVVAGLIATVFMCFVGFTTSMWQIYVIWSVVGSMFGFISPALGPVSARYGLVVYPKQVALVQGIPIMGMMLSNSFSQLIMADLVNQPSDQELQANWTVSRHDIQTAYFATGAANLLYILLFAGAAVLAAGRVKAVKAASSATPVEDNTAEFLARSTSESFVAAPLALPALERMFSGAVAATDVADDAATTQAKIGRVLSFQ